MICTLALLTLLQCNEVGTSPSSIIALLNVAF